MQLRPTFSYSPPTGQCISVFWKLKSSRETYFWFHQMTGRTDWFGQKPCQSREGPWCEGAVDKAGAQKTPFSSSCQASLWQQGDLGQMLHQVWWITTPTWWLLHPSACPGHAVYAEDRFHKNHRSEGLELSRVEGTTVGRGWCDGTLAGELEWWLGSGSWRTLSRTRALKEVRQNSKLGHFQLRPDSHTVPHTLVEECHALVALRRCNVTSARFASLEWEEGQPYPQNTTWGWAKTDSAGKS